METTRRGGSGRQGKRRQFTAEFKAGAVRLVLDDDKTVAHVARDLDLPLGQKAGARRRAVGRGLSGTSRTASPPCGSRSCEPSLAGYLVVLPATRHVAQALAAVNVTQ